MGAYGGGWKMSSPADEHCRSIAYPLCARAHLQHYAFLVCNVMMQLFFMSAHFRDPGTVPANTGSKEYERAMDLAAEGKLEQASPV